MDGTRPLATRVRPNFASAAVNGSRVLYFPPAPTSVFAGSALGGMQTCWPTASRTKRSRDTGVAMYHAAVRTSSAPGCSMRTPSLSCRRPAPEKAAVRAARAPAARVAYSGTGRMPPGGGPRGIELEERMCRGHVSRCHATVQASSAADCCVRAPLLRVGSTLLRATASVAPASRTCTRASR